jgi:HSP20 family protein
MALVRWDPARKLDVLQSDMNRLFDTFFQGRGVSAGGNGVRRWIPPMDLTETDDQFVLRADLPGLDENDVEIEIKDGVLTISGERETEHEERKEGFHRVERASGRFLRSLDLPDGIDAGAVTAEFDRGVLEVRIPKPEERQPTRVAIGGSGGARALEADGEEPGGGE